MRKLQIGDLSPSDNVRAGDWIVAGVRSFSAHTVDSLVPMGFQNYARLFHPAYGTQGDSDEVSWSDLAQANNRRAHPAMEWASITGEWRFIDNGGQPGVWSRPSTRGSLPSRQASRLAELLASFTTTPEHCWFAVWEGWSGLGAWAGDDAPKVEIPNRRMFLLSGPLSAAASPLLEPPGDQRANVWWPEDRAWCVVTDIDLMTTYIGGSNECIATLAADDELEWSPWARINE